MWTLVHMTFLSFSFLLQFSWIYSCRFRSIDNVFVDCINQIWTFHRATEFIWFLSHVKSISEFICRGLDFTLIFDKIEKNDWIYWKRKIKQLNRPKAPRIELRSAASASAFTFITFYILPFSFHWLFSII